MTCKYCKDEICTNVDRRLKPVDENLLKERE